MDKCTCNHPVARHDTRCNVVNCTCLASAAVCAQGAPFALNNTDLYALTDALAYYLSYHPKFASMRNEDLYQHYQDASRLEDRIKSEIGRRETGR